MRLAVPTETSVQSRGRSMSSIDVIIVAFNSQDVIGDCIASVEAQGVPTRICVIDNSIVDTTEQYLRANFSDRVTILRAGTNIGFGSACNKGLERASSQYALILNPDARLAPGALPTLLEAAGRHPTAALLAPGHIAECGEQTPLQTRDLFQRSKSSAARDLTEQEVQFLSGAVLLCDVEKLLAIGGFDERLFLYFEDDDICLRAVAAGHTAIIVPSASAIHIGGASAGSNDPALDRFKQRHMGWSFAYIVAKHRPGLRAAILVGAAASHWTYLWIRGCLRRQRVHTNFYGARIRGLADYLRGATPPREPRGS